jgi:hypothetical protein
MAALISALQRSGAPHILQTLPPPFFSESFFVLSSGVITSPLHCTVTRTTAARSRTLLSASLALTGRAPAVLLLLHVLPVSTDSLTRATTAAP